MTGPNERDEIAALIAEHRPGAVTTALNEAWIGCSCSERVPVPVHDLKMAWGDAYRAQEEHLADAVLASDWLAERDRRTAATAVRAMGARFRNEGRETWGGDVGWTTTGTKVAALAASWCDEEADRIEADQ